MKHKKLWGAFALVFVAGIILGLAFGHFRHFRHERMRKNFPPRGPNGFKKRILAKISSDLDLSPAQIESLNKNLTPKFIFIHNEHLKERKKFMQIMDDAIHEIAPSLSGKQLEYFKKLKEERIKRFSRENEMK